MHGDEEPDTKTDEQPVGDHLALTNLGKRVLWLPLAGILLLVSTIVAVDLHGDWYPAIAAPSATAARLTGMSAPPTPCAARVTDHGHTDNRVTDVVEFVVTVRNPCRQVAIGTMVHVRAVDSAKHQLGNAPTATRVPAVLPGHSVTVAGKIRTRGWPTARTVTDAVEISCRVVYSGWVASSKLTTRQLDQLRGQARVDRAHASPMDHPGYVRLDLRLHIDPVPNLLRESATIIFRDHHGRMLAGLTADVRVNESKTTFTKRYLTIPADTDVSRTTISLVPRLSR